MKVCLVHRYFWPDMAPYGVILRHIAAALAHAGHNVNVLTSQPSYKDSYNSGKQSWIETVDGFTVKRLRLPTENRKSKFSRLTGILAFSLKLFIQLFREKPDLVMVSTVPQVIGGAVVHLYAAITKTKFIYHCQDIHPEIAYFSGLLKNTLLYRVLKWIDRSTCNAAMYTIVLSEDMKKALIDRGCIAEKILIINNFELRTPNDLDTLTRVPPDLIRKNKFRLIFAGNIGKFQQLDTIILVARKIAHIKEIEFVFIGEGAAVKNLKRMAGDLLNETIFFYGQQPISVARELISDSQLSIVSLSGNMYQYAYPSKTMTYLCENSPLLVLINTKSELAKTVSLNELGIVSDHNQIDEIAAAIVSLYNDKAGLVEMKNTVIRYSKANFGLSESLSKWVHLYDDIAHTNNLND